MTTQERVISTKRLRVYQGVIAIPWILIFVVFGWAIFQRFELFGIYNLGIYGFIFYKFYVKRTLKLKSIAYDKENLYVFNKGHEIIIPFYEVKDVKLRSLLGVHSVNLYRDFGFGKEIYFKSSLWYPFNFKRVDNEVFKLQDLIESAKRNYTPDSDYALGS